MARIALNIIWDSPERFNKLIVHFGRFHIMCAYMGALGKMMTGSGFEEVLIDSGVSASGSINQVVSGKHYNRAFRVHQHMLNAITRLVMESFTESSMWTHRGLQDIQELAANPSFTAIVNASDNDKCLQFFSDFDQFCDDVHCGSLGKTAQLWITYGDCVWVLLRFLESVKENNVAHAMHSRSSHCVKCVLFCSVPPA